MKCLHNGDPYTCAKCNKQKEEYIENKSLNDKLSDEDYYYRGTTRGYSTNKQASIEFN